MGFEPSDSQTKGRDASDCHTSLTDVSKYLFISFLTVTVKSLLTDHQLSVFYMPLRSVSKNQQLDESNSESEFGYFNDWPNVSVLFEQDVEYCTMKQTMIDLVNKNTSNLLDYIQV